MVFSKLISTGKTIFKVESHQYCLNWYRFDVFIAISGHVFALYWRFRNSPPGHFYNKKQNSHKKHLCCRIFCNEAAGWTLATSLRILTGKKHPKNNLQRLRKIRILTFGSLVHQINSFKRFKNWNKFSKKIK